MADRRGGREGGGLEAAYTGGQSTKTQAESGTAFRKSFRKMAAKLKLPVTQDKKQKPGGVVNQREESCIRRNPPQKTGKGATN